MAELAPDLSEPGRAPSLASDVCPLLDLASGAESRQALPNPANRCGASTPPRAVGLLQQRLVCLDGAHADCPLFVRSGAAPRSSRGRAGRAGRAGPFRGMALGVVLVAEPSARLAAADRWARLRHRRTLATSSLPSPTVIASILLVAALVVAFAFISIRGGLALPAGELAAGSGAGSAGGPVASPPPSLPSSPSQGPSAGPDGTPSIAPTGTSASATPAATPTAVPAAYAGLQPCPDRPDCYLYRVLSGDSMTSIALHFGITPRALRAANPEISNPNLLHVGDIIRVPLPPA